LISEPTEDESIEDEEPLNSEEGSEEEYVYGEGLGEQSIFLRSLTAELKLNEPIYEDCEVTLLSALLDFATLYKDKSISKATLSRTIEIFQRVLPKPNIFPKSKFKFFNLIDKLCPEGEPPKVTYVCTICSNTLNSNKDSLCHKCKNFGPPGVNVVNDVESEFRHMFEYRNLHVLIDQYSAAPDNNFGNNISDIRDGRVCASNTSANKYDLMIMHNTDGFPFANSSTKQLWPNFLSVVNIEPKLRSRYIALESINFASKKPNLLNCMTDFTQRMQPLIKQGFKWRHPISGNEIISRVFVIVSALDASARGPIMNLNMYNSDYGCSFCEIETASRGKGQGPGKIYPFNASSAQPVLRTTERVLRYARVLFGESRAEREAQGIPHPSHIKGVKGFPPLGLLTHFDVINSFSPDYLHSCLIGVVKRWTKHILASTEHSRKNKYYVGLMSNVLDKKLKSLRVPAFVNRPPRAIKDLAYWKASEFRNWLFFYSLPCLEGILGKKYLEHHGLLVEAIYTLTKSTIPRSELDYCRKLLVSYCSQYANLYGKFEQTFNLHMLLHYVHSVEQIGPLWATSTFTFENANGTLRTSIHGTNNVAVELINTSKVHRALYTLKHIASVIKNCREDKKFELLGAKLRLSSMSKVIDKDIHEAIILYCEGSKVEPSSVDVHLSAKIGEVMYTSKDYDRAQKTCSYYLAYKDSISAPTDYCRVAFFFSMENMKGFIGHELMSSGHKFKTNSGHPVRHLQRFKVTEKIVLKKLETIVCPVFNIFDEQIAEPPNLYELNL
jgi:hypothetical protein